MQAKTTITDIDASIAALQLRQHDEWVLLKEELKVVKQHLTPANIMGHVVDGLGQVPGLGKKIGLTAAGLTAGVVVKKIIAGNGNNPVRKALGSVAEVAVADNLVRYVDDAKILGGILFRKIFKKKKKNTDSQVL